LTVDLPIVGIDQRLTLEGFSRYGVMQHSFRSSRGLPTALPASMKVGLRRYERGYTNGVASISGQVVLYLPDKEFRYLRTVIVTAAVYWGLDSKLRLAANLSS
jgi:hypothetical protein